MPPSKYYRTWRRGSNQRAFTLVELLAVLGIVAMLIGLLLPGLAAAKAEAKSAQCLNNNRQLSLAWLMYAGDNHGYFLYSADDGVGTAPYKTADTTSGHQGNNYAWAWSKMDFSGNTAYNTDPAADMMLRPMWNYKKNASIYKCPADTSTVSLNGTAIPRIRSYTMNFFLGGFGGNSADLSESGAHYSFYTKLT